MKSFMAIVVIVLAILTFSCKEELKVYRVGAVISLSGAAETYGRNVSNGIKLALDEINAAGGVKGKPLDVLTEDDQTDEKTAVEKIEQLNRSGVHITIGGVTSNLALAMVPAAEKNKMVLISPTATSPKLTGISQYFFRNFPSDTREGRMMAEYAVRRMKIRSVAILFVDKEYGQGLTEVFKNRFTQLGGNVVYEKAYPEATTDFTTYVTEIKEAAPDAIYLPGYYREIADALSEIKKQEVRAKLLSVQGMATPMFLEIAGEAAEGIVYPQPPFDPESKNPAIQKFVRAYREKFPTKPDVDAAFAYDALWIVAKAINTSQKYPDDLRARIADTNHQGITGEVTFDAGGDVDIEPRIFNVANGNFEPVR
jgi:branched-chain amino acid transport system substrate-binding protein